MSFERRDVYRIVLFKCLILGVWSSSPQQVSAWFCRINKSPTLVVADFLQRSLKRSVLKNSYIAGTVLLNAVS